MHGFSRRLRQCPTSRSRSSPTGGSPTSSSSRAWTARACGSTTRRSGAPAARGPRPTATSPVWCCGQHRDRTSAPVAGGPTPGRASGGAWSASCQRCGSWCWLRWPWRSRSPWGRQPYGGTSTRCWWPGLPEWIPTTLLTLILGASMTLWLSWWQSSAARRLGLALSAQQAVSFVTHALRLPMTFYVQRYAGDVAFRVGLVDGVSQLAAQQLIPAAVAMVTALAVGITLFAYSWPIALLACLAAASIVLILRLTGQWRIGAAARLAREQANFSGSLSHGLRSIETVKSSGTEADLFAATSGRHATSVNALSRLQVTSLAGRAADPRLGGADGADDLPRRPAGDERLSDAGRLRPSWRCCRSSSARWPTGLGWGRRAAAARVAGPARRLARPRPRPARNVAARRSRHCRCPRRGRRARRCRGSRPAALQLANVGFGYSPEAPILHEVSLRLSPGRRVG